MALFGTVFYGGGGNFYGPGSVDVPQDLKFYRTDNDGTYVFHWGFKEEFISPLLASADFDLELDTEIGFNSPNKVSFDSTTVINFQNGDARKGFAVPVAARLDKQEQIWYARVRTKIGFNASVFSLILQFVIPEKFELEETENIILNLPDFHVYNTEDVKLPLAERDTNLYHVANIYGSELDTVKLEDLLTKTNNYISLCRDEKLFDNFGILFDYKRPQAQEFVEYRECLGALIRSSLVGGTIDAIDRVIRCFTGVNPILRSIKDENDFFITPIFESPPEVPDGAIIFFSTSLDYKIGSLQVIQNGTVLNPGVDFTENHSAIGFDMTIAPLGGDILQIIFDIGDPDDPEPIIFDLSDTVALTGTITFTNGSTVISASGGAFLTEVQTGVLITDDGGLVLGRVRNVVDDDTLILTDKWTGITGANASAKKINFNGSKHLTGTITFNNGSVNVSGVGTVFLNELIIGDTITDNNGVDIGIVNSIIDNENLTLVSNWTGSTGSNTNAQKLIYFEPITWDSASLSHGLIIEVRNPGLFDLDELLIETLIRPLLPAHVEVFIEFI